MKNTKDDRRNNWMIGICILVVLICTGYIAWYLVQQKNQNQKYEELASEVRMTEQITEEKDTTIQIPVDFTTLQQQNTDIYAWISIPGMDIEYPVCQSAEDDSYYLNHTLDGTAGLPGTIYTESLNTKDFMDFNTVIYGHDMKNGSMFGDLKQLRDEAFLDEHSQILIYTPDCIRTYEIFAVVTYDDKHILKTYDFSNLNQRQKYLDSIYGIRDLNSPIRENVTVGIDSKLLTLSTCIAGRPDNRLLVEAVLINETK